MIIQILTMQKSGNIQKLDFHYFVFGMIFFYIVIQKLDLINFFWDGV